MIPKIIHYCWFGGAPKPESVNKCVNSWRKYCPDYEIREWTERDFDVSQNLYCQQAYEAKAWGFVPDYIRLWIIYNYGGIYLDTDVQLLKSFDSLLDNDAFVGFEKIAGNFVNLGQGFGAEPGNAFVLDNMSVYEDMAFLKDDGTYNKIASPVYTTEILEKRGLDRAAPVYQKLDAVTVYPVDYFCPKSFDTGLIERTENTYSIHHFDASWFTEEKQEEKRKRWKRARIRAFLSKPASMLRAIVGEKKYAKIKKYIRECVRSR